MRCRKFFMDRCLCLLLADCGAAFRESSKKARSQEGDANLCLQFLFGLKEDQNSSSAASGHGCLWQISPPRCATAPSLALILVKLNFVRFNGIFNELTNHKKWIHGEERQPVLKKRVQWSVQDHPPAQGDQPGPVWKKILGIKGGHRFKSHHPARIPRDFWHLEVHFWRCSSVFSCWNLFRLQENPFCALLSPLFHLGPAGTLGLSPSCKNQEGGNPEQSICLRIPDLQMIRSVPLLNEIQTQCCQWILGKGAFCSGMCHGLDSWLNLGSSCEIGIVFQRDFRDSLAW